MSGTTDPWGFPVENPDKFENPNWGPDASICAQSFASCSPRSIDFDHSWRWGYMPDAASTGPKIPTKIVSVTLPSVPYTGSTLQGTASGSGWSATVVWSPAHTATALGTAYTATFTLTPTGKNYFDPDAPPTVSVSASNGSGGTVSSATVVGDNEDGNVATMEITVVYSAVVNKPVAPPAGMFGYRGVINYTRQLSAINGGSFDTDDAVFDFIEPITKVQAQANWLATPYLDEDWGGRPFYFLTQMPTDIIDVNATVSTLSAFSAVTSVNIGGLALTGYLWTAGPTTGVVLKAII